MNKQRTRLRVVLAMISALSTITGSAVASNGGRLGTLHSTGTMNIRLHIPPRIQITELADIHLDWVALNKQSTRELSSDVCIITGTPAFQVTLARNNGAYQALKLSNGARELDYNARWIDHNGNKNEFTGAGHTPVSSAKIKNTQPCTHKGRTGYLASLALNFPKMPENFDRSATYLGALTLIVSPE